jgi:hypothetical protein
MASLTATAVLLLAGAAPAAIIHVSHSGATDPATEGFTFLTGSNWNDTSEAVTNDPVGGLDAWKIADADADGTNDTGRFDAAIDPSVDSLAASNGWVLRTRARAVSSNGVAANFISYGDSNFNGRHTLDLGVDGSGNAVVTVNFTGGNESYNTGKSGYVLYELVRDPNEDPSNVVDLFVDGSEVLSNVAAGTFDQNNLLFGDQTSGSTGGANYNLVEFQTGTTIIPEPASLVLLLLGGLILLSRRRRG